MINLPKKEGGRSSSSVVFPLRHYDYGIIRRASSLVTSVEMSSSSKTIDDTFVASSSLLPKCRQKKGNHRAMLFELNTQTSQKLITSNPVQLSNPQIIQFSGHEEFNICILNNFTNLKRLKSQTNYVLRIWVHLNH